MQAKCKHHDNCFTCPFDDCIADRIKKSVSEEREDQIREYKKLKQRQYRLNAMKREYPHINFDNQEVVC